MKKIYFIMIFLISFLLFIKNSNAQQTSLCEVTLAKFSQNGLTSFNTKNTNVYELTATDNLQPQINIDIETKNCTSSTGLTIGIFGYNYPKESKNREKILTLVTLQKITIQRDGPLTLPVTIGTKECKQGKTDLGTSEFEDCRYILGFSDDFIGDKGKSGISINDVNTNTKSGDNYHFIGLNRYKSVDIYNYAGAYGITFQCTETTCNKYHFTIGGKTTTSNILLEGAKSVNNGFTSDPCNEVKNNECYTLLSDVPIPEKNEGQFSVSHKNVKVQNGDEVIKKTVIQGIFPYQFAVDSFVALFIWVVIILAVIRLVYIGFKRIASEEAKNNKESRDDFINVFYGMGICFTFFVILNTINPDLLGKGPEIKMQTLQALGDIPTIASYSQTIKKTGSSSATPINIKINTLPGNAIWFVADMDIDMDGDYNNYSEDEKALVKKFDRRTNQPQTSWTFPVGKNYPNAFRFPYYVLPPALAAQYGLKLGDIGAIIYGNTTVYAVYADNGPHNKIGEGSAFLARQLVPSHTNLGAGLPDGISYILFPHSAISDLSSKNWESKVNEKGAKLFESVKSAYNKK